MGSIKVILPENLEKEFRDVIYMSKGMKRGNITEAVQEAIVMWIEVEKEKLETAAADLKAVVEDIRHPQKKKN